MIRMKNDKRAKHSAELLLGGLVKCINEKDFTEISISDLQKSSGVSRATFYRLFDNVQDVLAYKCELLAITMETEYKKIKPDEREPFLLFSLRFWLENHAFLDAIFKCNRGDILQNSLLLHTEHLTSEYDLKHIRDRYDLYPLDIASEGVEY